MRLGDAVDDRPRLGEAVQDAGLQYLLHQADHQQLVALDPLQVRAEAKAFSQPPELQRPVALENVPSGLETEVVIAARVDRGWQADRHTADGVDHADEAGEVELDEVVEADARRMLNGFPQAVGSAVGEAGVELLDCAGLQALAGKPRLRWAAVDRYDRVAGEADQCDAAAAGRDVRDHHGV